MAGRAIFRSSFSARTRTSTTSPGGSAPSRFSPSRSMPIACSKSSPSAFGQKPRNKPVLVGELSGPSAGAAPDVARARGEQRHRLGEVLLEMRRLLVRLEGLLVGVDLVQHDLRAIVRIDQHVELLAAGLLARVLRVFQQLLHEAVDVLRLDADLYFEHETHFSPRWRG